MLFQNSCEVPFGMTAMVSFLELPEPARLQLAIATTVNINAKIISLRISSLISLGSGADAFGSSHHWIVQFSDAFNINNHFVARLKVNRRLAGKAYSRRGARRDHITRFKRDRARQEFDQLRHAEDQLVSIRILHRSSVEDQLDRQLMRIAQFIRSDDCRPHRRESVARFSALPLSVGELKVARADIVEAGVAEHVVQSARR